MVERKSKKNSKKYKVKNSSKAYNNINIEINSNRKKSLNKKQSQPNYHPPIIINNQQPNYLDYVLNSHRELGHNTLINNLQSQINAIRLNRTPEEEKFVNTIGLQVSKELKEMKDNGTQYIPEPENAFMTPTINPLYDEPTSIRRAASLHSYGSIDLNDSVINTITPTHGYSHWTQALREPAETPMSQKKLNESDIIEENYQPSYIDNMEIAFRRANNETIPIIKNNLLLRLANSIYEKNKDKELQKLIIAKKQGPRGIYAGIARYIINYLQLHNEYELTSIGSSHNPDFLKN